MNPQTQRDSRAGIGPFVDRVDAGRRLASYLREYRDRNDVVVLGLARGGVPVAAQVARAIHAPLDVMVVRKIGAPHQPEYALGAVASGNVTVVNPGWDPTIEDSAEFQQLASIQRAELMRRETAYRGALPAVDLRERTVILVDDGAATGTSMSAAVRAVRRLGARTIVVALPVASDEAVAALNVIADRVICDRMPAAFRAVGEWYEHFPQTDDDEVRDLLVQGHTYI